MVGNRPGALMLLLGATLLFGGGCKEIDPQTGDLRPSCDDADSDPTVSVDFVRDLRPLINDEVSGTRGCLGCHSPGAGTMEGFLATGLDLSKIQALRRGGRDTAGKILVPGKPCESAIVQKLHGTFIGARMPKNGPYWDTAKIQLMRDWVAEGALGADE